MRASKPLRSSVLKTWPGAWASGFGLLAASIALGSAPARAGGQTAPNILILIADDHRGGTLGIDGDPRQATPRLDALARGGVRFTRAYCNAPVCTASRQSFITGRLPHAVGVTLLPTPLPESAVTLGDRLGQGGYATAAIGKMHFNHPTARHGFQTRIDTADWVAHLKANPPEGGDHRRPWRPFEQPASEWLNAECRSAGLPEASMESTYFADQAIQSLSKAKAGPFAMVVSFYDPHSPFRFPREMEGRFRPEDFPVPPMSEADRKARPIVFKELTGRDAQGIQAAYYTSIAYVDRQVGRVLDALDASGQAENTVVVFLGDHGYMLGEHGRFEKHCFYEPAIRAPLIVRWKGHLPEGRRVDDMVELVDLFPTVLSLLGQAPDPHSHGQSLVPLLKGEQGASGRDVVFGEYLENEEAMVRDGRFKLIVGTGRRARRDGYITSDPTPGAYEHLFDTRNDPGEAADLVDHREYDAVRDGLRHRLYERLTTTRDGLEPIPAGLAEVVAIRRCLVPHDLPPPVPTKIPLKKVIRNGPSAR